MADIFGLESRGPWPEGWTPLEAMAVVKALNEEGQLALVLASTAGLSCWEAAGMLRAGARQQEEELAGAFREDDGEDGD